MIEGVKIKKLKPIYDERGFLMEILRADDPIFDKFGQVYITAVNPGFVKAWHCHKLQTDNFTCVSGKVRVGLFDARVDSKTHGEVTEFILGIDEPMLIQIPSMVYHGFENITDEIGIIVNTPTETYNYKAPDELRLPFDTKKIPFKWDAKKGG
ncbi:MAG: dTDP-4-dehydrorhamnose 3,5-epimerase [Candidatus Altiarchaeales archaeon IMC4]|nr:MAG: dTDP-4-dehydrorhamnose 3,5-epimerase [Candidatus Altiarchaeales archaeon IMC4]